MALNVRLGDILDVAQLRDEMDNGLIACGKHPHADAFVLNYTARAQYLGQWSEVTKTCRGLLTWGHPLEEGALVLARPLAKFANVHEHGEGTTFGPLPVGEPFDVFEKMDGSLGIYYQLPDSDTPAIATRGSFTSPQALAATALLQRDHSDFRAPEGVTPLFEYVARWNRIVVDYGEGESLVLLAGVDQRTGADVDITNWRGERARAYGTQHDMASLLATLTQGGEGNKEGFVLRFARSGEPSLRVKAKYAEYLRLHRLVTGVSSVTIWELLREGGTLDELLDKVPDEFYDFVRRTADELTAQVDELVAGAQRLGQKVSSLTRKDAAAVVTAQSDVPASLVFGVLDGRDVRTMAWKLVRPAWVQPWAQLEDS